MNNTGKRGIALGVCICLGILCCCRYARAEDFIQVASAIHFSTDVSDGKNTILDILRTAREHDVKVIAITDRSLMRWEYGLWPLRNVIKKTVEAKSVMKYGIQRYLDELETMQKLNPDILIIPGVEAAPFYFWQGSIFRGNFTIKNWHKHMIVFGLERPGDYRQLPTIGNSAGLRVSSPLKDTLGFLWPAGCAVIGIIFFLRYPSRRLRALSLLCISIGLVFLKNNYPFCGYVFDAYHGDQGVRPYQYFIDYVQRHGGLVFWAHPEAENIEQDGMVRIETHSYTEDLRNTRDYTGFNVFYDGYEVVGHPGGLWDELLGEYCSGKRKRPVWALGGLGFDYSGEFAEYLEDLRTVLLVRELTKPGILDALREGRMYMVRGKKSSRLILERFVIGNSANGMEKTMGQELEVTTGYPRIEIQGCFVGSKGALLSIRLIRNGSLLKEFGEHSPFSFTFVDDTAESPGKYYYRLEISTPEVLLVSNPVFINKK